MSLTVFAMSILRQPVTELEAAEATPPVSTVASAPRRGETVLIDEDHKWGEVVCTV
jgi:hypothetical protein